MHIDTTCVHNYITRMYMYVCMYVCMYVYVCVYVCMYVFVLLLYSYFIVI